VTSTIPIVVMLADPVQFGLVAGLNRPGGNITGAAILATELVAKRLELLHELLPSASVFAVLINPANTASTEVVTRNLKDAARSLGLQLHFLRASTAAEIDAAFEGLAVSRADTLIVSTDPFFASRKDQIVALAARQAIPATYEWRKFAVAGGLMSYGSGLADSYRQAGIYTGKILKGAKPADLPVQQVVKLELVINLKTAKALGLTIPQLLLGRADEVIE
jgi:putative tryptophan/tyrosine transport system substrate-binding protein